MFPLLPFAVGIVAGGLAVRFLRDENTRSGLHKAGETLRSATQSGLTTIKTSTAAVRQHFAPEAPAAKPKAAPRKRKAPAKTASATVAAPERKAAAPRKRAAKPAKTQE